MVRNSSYHNPFNLPDGFTYEVKMVTRTRYKCAGWHILKKGEEKWVRVLPGTDVKHMHPSLYSAVRHITTEWRRLQLEVENIEKENGKVRS